MSLDELHPNALGHALIAKAAAAAIASQYDLDLGDGRLSAVTVGPSETRDLSPGARPGRGRSLVFRAVPALGGAPREGL